MCNSLNGTHFAPLIFFAYSAVLPWMRLFPSLRFYITILLQTFLRGIFTFIIMFFCCLVWGVILYYRNMDGDVSWLSFAETWHMSWDITWGENVTGWLENEPDNHWKVAEILWSLLAYLVFVNIMIAVSGAVFNESKVEWLQGELEIKNEFIVQIEKLFFWRRTLFFCSEAHNKEYNKTKHLVFVEADYGADDTPVVEIMGGVD